MKIGIVTLVGNYNYGNRLQNYAMTELLESYGHEVDTLVFPRRSDISFHRLKYKVNCLLGRVQDPEKSISPERLQRFKKFNESLSFVSVHGDYGKLNDAYDAFVVGSDQVWNPEFINDYNAYFLRFAEPSKRIAVAASFGVSSIPDNVRDIYAECLGGFKSISVREEAGVSLVRQLAGKEDCCCVIDPTLALSDTEWKCAACNDLNPDKPYIFSYMLGGITAEQENYLHVACANNGMQLVLLSDRDNSSQLPAGPADFIGLIDGADQVITNSFHGAVISSILKKPLQVMKKNGNDPTFSRLSTLSAKLGLGFECNEGSIAFTAKYDRLDEKLKDEREALACYLNQAGLTGKVQ